MSAKRLVFVFYAIQFQRDPFLHIDHIVNTLLPRGQLGTTAEKLAADIDVELATGESLTHYDMSDFGLSDEVLRAFLVALRARLVLK